MSNARLLVLADKIAALANQALSNSYASLTDTSIDAEMSTVPLERKTEILANDIGKRFLLQQLINKLKETRLDTAIEFLNPQIAFLDPKVAFLRKEFDHLL